MTLLFAYYDFRVAALTFDFAWFLAIASCESRKRKMGLSVTLLNPFYRQKVEVEKGYSEGYQSWRFHNIAVRLCYLCPDVFEVTSNRSEHLRFSGPVFPANYDPNKVNLATDITQMPCTHNQLEMAISGVENKVFFKSSAYADEWFAKKFSGSKVVVMNFRQTQYNADRNTPVDLWAEVYRAVRAQGYRVVVIPDQDSYLAGEPLNPEWEVVPEACMDLDLRLALYRGARGVLAWAGGTNSLLPLCGARFMTFGIWNEGNVVSNKAFLARKGPAWGTQPPWFDYRRQRYDWQAAEATTAAYVLSQALPWLAGLEAS